MLFLVSLAGLSPPGFFCFFVDVAPNPRILCTRICEFSTATACVLSHVFFLCILSSSQDKMHCTLSLTVCTCTPCHWASFNSTTDSFSWGHDPYTLACKARPSFDRCGTSLSVSLSLSLSRNVCPKGCGKQRPRGTWQPRSPARRVTEMAKLFVVADEVQK